MSNLSIRKLDEETLKRLRRRAAEHGVSMEEEVRQILKWAVTPSERVGDLAVRLFTPAYGGESLKLPSRTPHAPIKL